RAPRTREALDARPPEPRRRAALARSHLPSLGRRARSAQGVCRESGLGRLVGGELLLHHFTGAGLTSLPGEANPTSGTRASSAARYWRARSTPRRKSRTTFTFSSRASHGVRCAEPARTITRAPGVMRANRLIVGGSASSNSPTV